jgi:DNA-binding response OmpR family regulator
MNILIVEDELALAREIADFLTREQFTCEKAFNGKQASEKIATTPYDFVLLDLGLPDYEGIDILKEAKKLKSEAAFIILTARGEVNDRIIGLDEGADDYLAKPFALPELLARIHAIARRKFKIESNTAQIGDFTLDLVKHTIKADTQIIEITKKEFNLISYLFVNKNRVLTRMQLSEHIWGNISEDDHDSNYIDVHIKNIRKKLGAYGDVSFIETIRGIGYKVNTAKF